MNNPHNTIVFKMDKPFALPTAEELAKSAALSEKLGYRKNHFFPDATIDEALKCSDEHDDDQLICRAAFGHVLDITKPVMWMPAGLQVISPEAGGIGQPIQVFVDRAGAAAAEEQRAALVAANKKPYFDLAHENGLASFWPEEYFWSESPEPGIYARGEYTRSGKDAIEGKDVRQFSPVFHVDNKRAKPARIINGFKKPGVKVEPNMGGFLNDPAFYQISPLWARNAPGAQSSNQNKNTTITMTPEELAALQAAKEKLENEVAALKARASKDKNDAIVDSELKAKEADLRSNALTLENESLKAQNKTSSDAIKARNKVDAEIVVKDAVTRGAIAAQDQKTQDALVARATEDPGFCDVIKAMAGNAALESNGTTRRATHEAGRTSITKESPNAVMKEYGSIVARNAKLPMSEHKEKGRLAREAAAIFASDMEGDKVIEAMTIDDAIKAADYSDPANQVGLLSGSLVLQRALPLMEYEYPMLSTMFTDFSDAPGLLNNTEVSRIVLKPAVQSFDVTVDSAGRPKGWSTVSPAQTVDVPLKLDEYVGVPIVFGNNTLASTIRNLFGEVAPMALYAIGGYFVNKATALMTPANFNAYAGTTASVTTTSGSNLCTAVSTASMYAGQPISGAGIPANAFVLSVTDATDFVLSANATASATITATLGSGKVPTTYATYVKALSDFNMASLIDIGVALDNNEVPQQSRYAMLNASYYGKLAADPSFNTFFAAIQSPDVITKGRLPELQGIMPQKAPYFPTSNNRIGFAYHKAAIALKARPPQDLIGSIGAAAPGSVSLVTAPSGLTVSLVQYINLTGMYAEWRPEVLLGAAVGDRRAGLVLTSQ